MSQVAIVTGGTRGIGLGIARRLSVAGFDLVVCGRRKEEDVGHVVRDLGASGRSVCYARADVSSAEDRERLIETTRSRFGRLDVLVNNAGMAPPDREDILEASEASYDVVMDVNLKGPYFLTQLAARWMIEQRGSGDASFKTITFVSSISATVASPNRGEYCLSKSGLAMAVKLWAARLGAFDIPVYEVRPGIIETDMTSGVKQKYDQLIDEGLLVEPRWGGPDDVAHAVTLLAEGKLPYATGQVLVVDGGLTLPRL